MFNQADYVYSYSRAQAIEDGALIDVSEVAREAGFTIPTVLTDAAWQSCVSWNEADTDRTGMPQDEQGRLWDVLWMAAQATRANRNHGGPRLNFRLRCVPRDGRRPVNRELSIHIGPGDAGEPVITIMLPQED